MKDFAQSIAAYEAWLKAELKGDLVAADLERKHEKMRESAFAFLRATYWRWAETVPEAGLPKGVLEAPAVLAVGDLHLENFGTWRDADGRLVWGVNDFDEAAEMPFTLDLVRLATSARLGNGLDATALEAISGAILAGYRASLKAPAPIVLEREWAGLRARMVVSEKDRAKFWEKLEARKVEAAPASFMQLLTAAMPEAGLQLKTGRRVAGLGSLGRPRWVAWADWRGGLVVREAKALLPSAWDLTRGRKDAVLRVGECAEGPYRCCDPWYKMQGRAVVRRLSPNNRKIEAGDPVFAAGDMQIFEAMGREVANIHLGSRVKPDALAAGLAALPKGWLVKSAAVMADAVKADFKAFKAL